MVLRKQGQTQDEALVNLGCGCAIIVFAIATWVGILVLCYKTAEYFGYPGWLGIAAYVIVSALLGSLRATRSK